MFFDPLAPLHHGNCPYVPIDGQKGPYDLLEKDSLEKLKEIYGRLQGL